MSAPDLDVTLTRRRLLLRGAGTRYDFAVRDAAAGTSHRQGRQDTD